MAWFAAIQARADPIAFCGPQASGAPTRMAEQNRCIWKRVAGGRTFAELGPVPDAALAAPWFVFAAIVSEVCATAPVPAGVTSMPV